MKSIQLVEVILLAREFVIEQELLNQAKLELLTKERLLLKK